MYQLILVAIGGALGATFRHLVGLATMKLLGIGVPWGTFTVNVIGALLMGVFIEFMYQRELANSELRLFVATGFLGGFTTFSAFAYDFREFWVKGELVVAFSYMVGSVVFSLLAIFLGFWLVRSFAS